MMSEIPKILNCTGLFFDMVGVLVIAHALSKISRTGTAEWANDTTQITENKLRKKEYIGLSLVIFGFFLQFLSNFY